MIWRHTVRQSEERGFTFDTEEEAKKFAEGSWKDAAIDEDQTFEAETIEAKTDTNTILTSRSLLMKQKKHTYHTLVA